MAYVAMALIFLGFLLIAKYEALKIVYAEFCMAILGATTVYVGGNSIVKWMGAKNKAAPEEQSPEKSPEK